MSWGTRASAESFVAIDFETANRSRDSVCAVGVVMVEGGRVVDTITSLVRPPTSHFEFSYIHGIGWDDVREAPSFRDVWHAITPRLRGTRFLAAHNAAFDRSVLAAACTTSRVSVPAHEFVCTVKLARAHWSIYPTRLPDVCAHLGINLEHHDAGSDATACAQIVIAAQKAGWRFGQ